MPSQASAARVARTLITCSACISACARGLQWQRALHLFSEMPDAMLTPDVISYYLGFEQILAGRADEDFCAFDGVEASQGYNASISACQKGGQWQWSVQLLSDLQSARLTPDVVTFGAVASACEKGALPGMLGDCGFLACPLACLLVVQAPRH